MGVTHWALWEKQRAALQELVRQNPSLSFLQSGDELFPITVRYGEALCPLDSISSRLHVHEAQPLLLQAQGGMGKTTALMTAALRLNEHYDPSQPVAVYISAYGYREGEQWFIHDQMLRSLRFSRDTHSYEDARHELDKLLSNPLPGSNTPAVLLLLDGLNEISCDAAPLLKELNELTSASGLSIVIASRLPP